MQIYGLDFETYSPVNIKEHGLDRYINDSYFRSLMADLASPAGSYNVHYDFVRDKFAINRLFGTLDGIADSGDVIGAHNAPFERAVLNKLGYDWRSVGLRIIDTAVIGRMAGGATRLEAAATQLLGTDKMSEGAGLIKLFCTPSKEQLENGSLAFDEALVHAHWADWLQFGNYCSVDATLSRDLLVEFFELWTLRERDFEALTSQMNEVGWPVDLALVEEMNWRYHENVAKAEFEFRERNNAQTLNLNSLKQLKEWCAARGIKATSFNEASVTKMIERIEDKLLTVSLPQQGFRNYVEVLDLLKTKQILGGSSLKKLQTILDRVGEDGRLRHQYMHCGAGQTFRTTGTGVQMQNLKRLPDPDNPAMMEPLLEDDDLEWDNDQLAENLRQCFTSSDPHGLLFVGDFKSVESRGLAWLAGASWKLNEYYKGRDMYKVLATRMFHGLQYNEVTKSQRTTGKVGELACGYGAGPEAVRSFAEGMGVTFTLGEAEAIVNDWRSVNPEIVTFWNALNTAMIRAVNTNTTQEVPLIDGFSFAMRTMQAPLSLSTQVGRPMRSLHIMLYDSAGELYFRRVFHGVHQRGRNIAYFRPSDRKTGDLWKNFYIDPKTKQRRFYELYGGKLAGILTQSLCREIFMDQLVRVNEWVQDHQGLEIIGQFHDEIVLDYTPLCTLDVHTVKAYFQKHMSEQTRFPSFPLAADIKFNYRYNK